MSEGSAGSSQPLVVGRYAVFDPIAAGGMATVHFGQLLGPVGFSRVVAIKRLHPMLAHDPEFVAGFLDEARLAARIRHPNVVPTLDVVATKGELFVVMEFVQGESLSRLVRSMKEQGQRIPPRIVASILSGTLQGLHAAHEATDESGRNLDIVHRDVSPQNILVGADGTARVLDFGIAKAVGRHQTTKEGQIKGKLSYMAPEQLKAEHTTRQADIYAAGVVLWEALTFERLFKGDTEAVVLARILASELKKPSDVDPSLAAFDDVTMKALAPRPEQRFATAREMALAVERCVGIASAAEVAEWLEQTAGPALRARAAEIAAIETGSNKESAAIVKRHLEAIARGESLPPPAPESTRAPTVTSTRLGLGGPTPVLASRPANATGAAALQTRTLPTEIQPPSSDQSNTSLSSLSVAVAGLPRRSEQGSRARWAVIAAAAALVVGIGGVVAWRQLSRDAVTDAAAAKPATHAATHPPEPARDVPPPPSATTEPSPPKTSSVASSEPPPATTTTAAQAAKTGTTPRTTSPSRPAAPAGGPTSKPKDRFDSLGGRD